MLIAWISLFLDQSHALAQMQKLEIEAILIKFEWVRGQQGLIFLRYKEKSENICAYIIITHLVKLWGEEGCLPMYFMHIQCLSTPWHWARAQGPKEPFAGRSECLNTAANNIGNSRTKIMGGHTCMVPATTRGRAIMTAPTSARGWALSPTLISKRDETCLSTWGDQPQELHCHGSGRWVQMDGRGWLQTCRWPTACL